MKKLWNMNYSNMIRQIIFNLSFAIRNFDWFYIQGFSVIRRNEWICWLFFTNSLNWNLYFAAQFQPSLLSVFPRLLVSNVQFILFVHMAKVIFLSKLRNSSWYNFNKFAFLRIQSQIKQKICPYHPGRSAVDPMEKAYIFKNVYILKII